MTENSRVDVVWHVALTFINDFKQCTAHSSHGDTLLEKFIMSFHEAIIV